MVFTIEWLILFMKNQQQNEDELTPWGHDESLPRNIIIEFQRNGKTKSGDWGTKNHHKKMKLASNLDRYLQKRKWNLAQKHAKKQEQSLLQESIYEKQKITINHLQPEKVYSNDTIELSQMFPSYSLKKVNKDFTYYKPQRYHSIHKTQYKEDSNRSALKYSTNSANQENVTELTRNMTAKKVIHFSITKRSFLEHQLKSCDQKYAKWQKDQKAELHSISNAQHAINLKKMQKSKKFQEIIEFLEKREKQKSELQRTKTSPDPVEMEKCLKSKKQFYLNLPKIQFIQFCQ